MLISILVGQSKHVSITKSESALGFNNHRQWNWILLYQAHSRKLKKLDIIKFLPVNRILILIQDGSVASLTDQISVGDHIAAIDGKVTVGLRHFQVAKILKEIPIETTFTISLITPQKGFGELLSKFLPTIKCFMELFQKLSKVQV